MANHISLFYWLKHTVKITLRSEKDFFSVEDKSGNDLTFYGDDKQILFEAFCKVCPAAEIKKN